MTIGPHTTLPELALIVGTALHAAGIDAVLSGGGAATFYAPEANQSGDLDFILSFGSALGVSAQSILDLGFQRVGGTYVHPGTQFTLEFPPGPLMIGDELIAEWATIRADGCALQILTPTDCVRDRLAWFLLYSNVDYAALEQALAVASRHPVDLAKIKSWAAKEGAAERYEIFESRYLSLNL